jgi:hypothetical protein
MRKTLISFGGTAQGPSRHRVDRNYTREVLERLFPSGRRYFDHFTMYDNSWLVHQPFYPYHKDILDLPSFGWAFKAAAVFDALNHVLPGDVVFWCDSNHEFTEDPTGLINYAVANHIYCHNHTVHYPNVEWTRMDTFVNMGCTEERYKVCPQMQVNIMAFKKDPFTMMFVAEWFTYSMRYDVIIGRGQYPDHACFSDGWHDHRHEQSIFSILREKYDLPYDNYPGGIVEGGDLA